jgi:dolichyl-phosphate beta-glucosyltransferase
MKISIVIPCYNEDKRIEETLKRTINYCKKNIRYHEIIVINDGSKDRTLEIVKKFKNKNLRILSNKTNLGKGASIRRGISRARQPLVLFMDADLSTPLKEIKKLHECTKKYDFIIGSRNLIGSKIKKPQTFIRKNLGWIYKSLKNKIIGHEIVDSQCGFKLIKTTQAKQLIKLQKIDRFSFDVEMILIAKKMKMKIKEVGIEWDMNQESSVKIIKDGMRMLIDLVRIKYYDKMKKYN